MVSFLWGLLVLPLSLILLVVAVTWTGRAFAMAGLLGGLAPFVAAMAWDLNRPRWGRRAGIAAALFLGILATLAIRAPSGKVPQTARAQNIFFDRDPHPLLTAAGNLVPEVDQLMFCYTAARLVDPLLTASQGQELKQLTAKVYTALERDPDFRDLGSAMSDTYAALLGLSGRHQHIYLYIPSGVDRTKPTPALVFLHGSGGNFKGYLWLLAKIADRLNWVVIAPTDGMGHWPEPEVAGIVNHALTAAARRVTLDASNLHLMGLSNGGLGVSRLGRTQGAKFRSLVFLSPVIDQNSVLSAGFRQAWTRRPILILTGQADDRVPFDSVVHRLSDLQATGASLTFQSIPDANHFLIFSHSDLVIASLENWLAAVSGDPFDPSVLVQDRLRK